MAKSSKLESEFEKELKKRKIKYEREVQFVPGRKFRADFVVKLSPRRKYIVECMGGVWRGGFGGHTSGKGYVRDSEKILLADLYGYKYLQVCTMKGDNPVSPEAVADYLQTRKTS